MLKNKKGVELTFSQIIAILIVLALIIWAFFYLGDIREQIAAIAERFLG